MTREEAAEFTRKLMARAETIVFPKTPKTINNIPVFYFEAVLSALREKAERERGCAYCVIGKRSPDAEYCSNCGRKLTPTLPDTTANIISETADTLLNPARTDADKGVEIMENRINQRYGSDTETPAERIIRLYRGGMSHVDIAGRGFDLADVRRVISEATRVDETLYQAHKGIESRWSKRERKQ